MTDLKPATFNITGLTPGFSCDDEALPAGFASGYPQNPQNAVPSGLSLPHCPHQALDHLRSLTKIFAEPANKVCNCPQPRFPLYQIPLAARRGTSHSRRPYSYESYSRGPQSIWPTRIHSASKLLLQAISSSPLSGCPDAPEIFASTFAPSESSTDPVEYTRREPLRTRHPIRNSEFPAQQIFGFLQMIVEHLQRRLDLLQSCQRYFLVALVGGQQDSNS